MKILAVSDIHVDYQVNADWLASISSSDHKDDVLIVAGDISDTLAQVEWAFHVLSSRFKKVLFVPGNHDLWVLRSPSELSSFDKFKQLAVIAEANGIAAAPLEVDDVTIIPLLGWYDFSFGHPNEELQAAWMDFHACRWPIDYGPREVAEHFSHLNRLEPPKDRVVITFSHFLPRLDVIPLRAREQRWLHPVLGMDGLDLQLRELNSRYHVYGHSHVRQNIMIDNVTYINNAIGYPHETWLGTRNLHCVLET